jgi:hypothetical protein
MRQTMAPKKRQVVDIAQGEDLPLVEIGTGSIAPKIVRVEK